MAKRATPTDRLQIMRDARIQRLKDQKAGEQRLAGKPEEKQRLAGKPKIDHLAEEIAELSKPIYEKKKTASPKEVARELGYLDSLEENSPDVSKKRKCYNCGAIAELERPLKRGSDGYDIFPCPSCGVNFKIDIHEYMNNRGKEGFVTSTFDATRSMAHSSPLIEQRTSKEIAEGKMKINWRHPITLIIVGFLALSIFYYIFSPYQNCVRNAGEPNSVFYKKSDGYIATACAKWASW